MKLIFIIGLTLSAALLFNVQPMLGKLLLPKVGGSPTVWNVAMACFQLLLLGGYLLAHVLSRFSPRMHGFVYLAVLVLAGLTLPIHLPEAWQPGSQPVLAIIQVILLSTGPAFIALALTAPTLQRLFAASGHRQAGDPYFLYAASNLGSFTGLLAYPLLLEPVMGVSRQTEIWQQIFWALLVAAASCVWLLRKADQKPQPIATTERNGWKTIGGWVLLAFIPSSLTLGTTTIITTDISPTPMLWVGTLGIYLLSFIAAFAYSSKKLLTVSAVFVFISTGGLVAWPLLSNSSIHIGLIVLHLLALGSISLNCHLQLSLKRPGAAQLTSFYLWLSVGGALGGAFNAFLAPVIFKQPLEHTLVMLCGMIMAINLPLVRRVGVPLIAGTIVITGWVAPTLMSDVFIGRSFFSIVRVIDEKNPDSGDTIRYMLHGNTRHGLQIIKPEHNLHPIGYYAPESPIADIWRTFNPQTVSILGLGTGGLNCFAKPGQQYMFVEIDQLVIDAAEKYFTYLSDCPKAEILLGDGRLVLAGLDTKYDMIVTDAFSSDAIPTHLMTIEALQMYLQHLTPKGVVAIHISNRFFDLEPVLGAAFQQLGLHGLIGYNDLSEYKRGNVSLPSTWVVVANTPEKLAPLAARTGMWRPLKVRLDVKPWTDDYSSLIPIIRKMGLTVGDGH